MANEIFNILKATAIFSALDDQSIAEIIPKLTPISLSKDENLFEQGDESDSLYILASGKLVILVKQKQREKIIGDVDPTETVGELGAISDEPRSATVQAVEDSVVYKLQDADFHAICQAHPQVIIELMNNLVNRSRSMIKMLSEGKIAKKHLVIFAANEEAPIKLFVDKIKEFSRQFPDLIMLSDEDEHLRQKFPTADDLKQLTAELIKENHIILYILNFHETPLMQVAMDNADMLYVLGSGDRPASINAFALRKIHSKGYIYKAKPELILLHVRKKRYPIKTRQWLKLADFGMHHHLRLEHNDDFERMIRFFRGVAVGLVLGGGGVRSWAHLGVIKALKELNIPIDAVGGTSAGSIVGGYYALHNTYKDLSKDLHLLSRATRRTICVTNLTWPAVSLFDGKDFTLTEQRIYKKARIENLWLPFFCVSCNLAKSSAVMHKSGLLWRRIRSSTSVPGIFPPVVIRGQIHLDGGIVNNLPVDFMQKLSGSIGNIIAVELVHHVSDYRGYNFPSILPFWKVILSKLRIAYRDYRFPHFVDTFLKSLLVGAAVKQKENATLADIVIRPDLSKFHLLSVTEKQEKELTEIGYNETIRLLKKSPLKQDLS